ncbi:MAG: double zinc ribbon domain-containing protein [Chloroflexia bacterium]
MYCPRCGESNPRSATECANCGNPVSPPPAPGIPGGRTCPMCLAATAPDAVFCATCGTRLAPQAPTVSELSAAEQIAWLDTLRNEVDPGEIKLAPELDAELEQPSRVSAPPPPSRGLPNWVTQRGSSADRQEPAMAAAPEPSPVAAFDDSDLPAWMSAPAVTETAGQGEATTADDLPTWMNRSATEDELPAWMEAPTPSIAGAQLETPGPALFAPAAAENVPPSAGSRRRQTAPLIAPPEPVPAQAGVPQVPPAPTPIETGPGEIPVWLRALGGEEGAPDVGAGDRGLTVGAGGTRVIARPPRPGAVDVFERLLAPAAHPPSAATRRRPTAGIWPDRVFHVLLIVVVVAVWVLNPFDTSSLVPDPTQPSDGKAFYDALNKLPAGKPVLLVYDWDASRYAEMHELSGAVTRYLMSRSRPFATISTLPEGTGFAVATTEAATTTTQGIACGGSSWPAGEYGRSYLHLGYRPGNEAGLAELVGAASLADVQSYDAVCNQPVRGAPMLQNAPGLKQFAAIVLLAGEEQPMRVWIEQAGTQLNIPLLAAMPESGRPAALPYASGAHPRIQNAVYGMAGARDFEAQLGAPGAADIGDMGKRLGTESAALLILVLALLIAFTSGIYRWANRRSTP